MQDTKTFEQWFAIICKQNGPFYPMDLVLKEKLQFAFNAGRGNIVPWEDKDVTR